MKTCFGCNTEKELDKFRSGRNKCYACQYADHRSNLQVDDAKKAKRYADLRQYSREWKEKNPEKWRSQMRKRSWKSQGIDPVLAEQYYQSHNGKCDVCDGSEPSGKALAIDHCHITGQIRGMLCSACNTSAGLLRDDPVRIRKLAEYLEAASESFVRVSSA